MASNYYILFYHLGTKLFSLYVTVIATACYIMFETKPCFLQIKDGEKVLSNKSSCLLQWPISYKLDTMGHPVNLSLFFILKHGKWSFVRTSIVLKKDFPW